jgi:hypothetical protein
MPSSAADGIDELVRAHAYSRLGTLPVGERVRWAERFAALSSELGLAAPPAPRQGIQLLVWNMTMASLSDLRSVLQDGPAWLVDRYASAERALLEAYAESHVDVLRALARRGS